MQEKERVANEEAEKRLKAALTAKREPNATASRVASPSPGADKNVNGETAGEPKPAVNESKSGEIVMESAEERTATAPEVRLFCVRPRPPQRMTFDSQSPWLPELYALFDDVRKIAPGTAAEVIGYAHIFLAHRNCSPTVDPFRPAFYLTFWQLSTYDLSPPAAKYDEECATLRTLSRQEDSMYITADRSADRAKRMTAPAHRDKRNRINAVVQQLSEELKEQTAARAFTIKRIAREKQHWFAHSESRLIPWKTW